MMWNLGLLVAAALVLGCCSVPVHRERVVHGRQLKIYLPKNAEKLLFTRKSYEDYVVFWERSKSRPNRGRVTGTGSDRRWYLDKVTNLDEGTFVLKDSWNREISLIEVDVIAKRNHMKCVAGETLRISLDGVDEHAASLFFVGYNSNFTLVRKGNPLSEDYHNYWGRVKVKRDNIEILNVNYTDEGLYVLKDQMDRDVSFTRMELTEAHDYSQGNPLLALLLLLGIPAGICCCCRKKIFKKKAANATTMQAPPANVHPPPASGPVGPSPPYVAPGQPGPVYYHGGGPNTDPTVHPPPMATGPGQWNGPPPAAGFNPGYPPQNPAYPPAGPAMVPPGQPHWNGPPPGQYPPGPVAPVGYAPAPAMYSVPPSASEPTKEGIKMENMATSPADPLLTSNVQEKDAASLEPPVPPYSTSGLGSTTDTYMFNISGEKSSNNFL